ncbi:MAG: ATP-binding cassette domain-containing protein [Ignavibacteriaceae bacterium]
MSIHLENITKSYNGLPALKNISLNIPGGNTTVLIGPSGSGKSSLIRIIIGLIKADSGKVLINDEVLTQDNLNSIRRNTGYVIQEGGLFPHLTAGKNVTLLAEYLKWNKEKINTRVAELAELTNFPPGALNRFPAELSGGQNQRVSLMRALMPDPQILLLDEPLGALDPLIRYDLQNDLKDIFQRLNKTVVIVTHDLNEAAFFGDKIVLMKDGLIVQEGTL